MHVQHYRPNLFMQALWVSFPKIDVSHLDRRLASVEADGMKYLWASDGRHELYDLTADPNELSNLVEARPQVVRELEEVRVELN